MSVKTTADGGAILVGATNSAVLSSGKDDMWIVKTNSIGDTLWSKSYGTPLNWEGGYNIIQTNDKGYIAAGIVGINWGNEDIYLVKIDSLGNLQWSKEYSTSNTYNFSSYDIKQLKDSSYIVVGTIVSSSGQNITLLKTSSTGNVLWSKFINAVSYATAYSLDTIGNDLIIACGVTPTSPPWPNLTSAVGLLIKINSLGNIIWWKAFADGLTSVRTTKDKGFILANKYYSKVIKTDSLGYPEWTTQLTDYSDMAPCIMQTNGGGYAAIGNGPIGSPGATLILSKLDSTGKTPCSNSISSPLNTALQVSAYNLSISAASFGSTLATHPYAKKIYFLYKDTICVPSVVLPSVHEQYNELSTTILQNPFSTQTVLRATNSLHNATLILYNSFGQVVKQINNISGQTITIDRDDLASGLYFIRLTEGDRLIATDKLVITDR